MRFAMTGPDLKIIGLSMWVHGRELESSDDYWDGNWLRVTVRCQAHGATIEVSGSIVHLTELKAWLHQARELHSSLTGTARLDCIEPNLRVCVTLTHGKGELLVEITPDNMSQEHRLRFEIDHVGFLG